MKYDEIKLSSQLCFPLYACSKEIIRKYTPLLEHLALTYTQYIVMMVLWENKSLNINELGKYLYLDSGTLTPLVKKLEQKGYLVRKRKENDERQVMVTITESGEELKDKALEIHKNIKGCINLTEKESKELYILLYKVLKDIGGK